MGDFAAGKVRWASGEHDSAGRLLDGAGAVLAAEKVGGGYLPHRDEIHGANEVQVYEAIARDRDGLRSRSMLATTGYLKDSRLLPTGWRPQGPAAAWTGPVLASADPDFDGGGDSVTWLLAAAPAADGPSLDPALIHSAEVSLLWQPLGARHLAELLAVPTEAGQRLAALLQGADMGPELVAELVVALN